jgi:hypothetical protein
VISIDRFLEAVPEEAATIDVRGVLLEEPTLFGDPAGFVAVRRGGRLLVASGRPSRSDVEAALATAQNGADLVAIGGSEEVAAAVLGDSGERALLHRVGEDGLRRQPGLPDAVLLDPGAPVGDFEEEVRIELGEVLGVRPVGAVIVEGRPVSVCYAAVVTEHLWDVSIETLAGFRRGGRAAAAFWRVVDAMPERKPVWGAVESNTASLRLAAELGFIPAGELKWFGLGSARNS